MYDFCTLPSQMTRTCSLCQRGAGIIPVPACLTMSASLRQITVAMAIIIGVVLYRLSVLASLAYWEDDYVSSYAMLFTNATAATINLVIVLLLNQVRDGS